MKLFKVDGMLTYEGKDYYAETRVVAAEDAGDIPGILEHHRLNSYDKPNFMEVAIQEIELKAGVLLHGETIFTA
jgi:hypothetical protein